MTQRFERWLSMLLTLTLVLTMLPTIVFAADDTITGTASGGIKPTISYSGILVTTGTLTLPENDTFTIDFGVGSGDNFDWDVDSGTKDYSAIDASWLNADNATIGTDFDFVSVDPTTGIVTIQALAAGTYNGVQFHLDDGGTPTTSTDYIDITVQSVHAVTFDPNGGSGTMAPGSVVDGGNYTIPANTFRKAGYTFAGWKDNSSSNSYGSVANRGTITNVTRPVTLTAQWTANAPKPSDDSSNDYIPSIPPVITGLNKNLLWGYKGPGVVDGNTLKLDDIIVQDKPEISFNLLPDMFGLPNDTPITMKLLRNSKITVRTSVKAGSKIIDSVKFDGDTNTTIKVNFAERLVSTKDVDFDVTVYLWLDGKRQDEGAMQIYGNYANSVITVDADDDYFDGSDGAVAEATDFVKSIDFDLGKGVTIETKMFKDKKYYGVANRDVDAADDVVFAKYPDIDNVVTLYTVGLNQTGDKVKFDDDYADYYVYDKDMKYLGRATDKVPYSVAPVFVPQSALSGTYAMAAGAISATSQLFALESQADSAADEYDPRPHVTKFYFSKIKLDVKEQFTDTASHWAKSPIDFVTLRDLFADEGGGRFNPNGAMTRAMFVTVLAKFDRADLSRYKISRFDDVPTGEWYSAAVEWAAQYSIVTGYDGKFSPNAPITREEMAVILYGYIKYKECALYDLADKRSFADGAKISPWAKTAVESIQIWGIMGGKPANLFDPQGAATRGEAATVFELFMEALAL